MTLTPELRPALVGSDNEAGDDEVLSRSFFDVLERGEAAWPGFSPANKTVAEVVRSACGDEDPSTWLQGCDAREVWLAAGCIEGLRAALREFDARYIAPLVGILDSTQLDAGRTADVQQRVRAKMLGEGPDGIVRIARYCGRGGLAAMTKVIAIRSAVDLARVESRHPERQPSADDQAVARLVDDGLGPERTAMGIEQRAALKQAFEDAVARLDGLERGVLRLHLVERVSIDEIAAVHNVHRATAARWLTRIRERLGQSTRVVLRDRFALTDAELDSFMRVIDHTLDLSLSRVLEPGMTDDR